MEKEILRAYKFRIYPDAEQKDNLARTFGSSRYVFNWALDLKDQSYKEGVKLNAGQISAALTQLKKTEEFSWLNEVSSVCLQQSLMNLDIAYKNFFLKVKQNIQTLRKELTNNLQDMFQVLLHLKMES